MCEVKATNKTWNIFLKNLTLCILIEKGQQNAHCFFRNSPLKLFLDATKVLFVFSTAISIRSIFASDREH